MNSDILTGYSLSAPYLIPRFEALATEEVLAPVLDLRNLGMQVTAEGAETHEQVERLRVLGCDYAQGLLFSKPTAASRVPWLIKNWRESTSELADAS